MIITCYAVTLYTVYFSPEKKLVYIVLTDSSLIYCSFSKFNFGPSKCSCLKGETWLVIGEGVLFYQLIKINFFVYSVHV